MVVLPLGAHALQRVVPGLGLEHVPILRQKTAAKLVQAIQRKIATRKPVSVGHFVTKAFFLSLLELLVYLKVLQLTWSKYLYQY